MRQTILGVLFLAIGIAVLTVGLGNTPVDKFVTVLGLAIAIFGAVMIPSSGAGDAAQKFVTVFGAYIPRVGGSRPADPPAKDDKG